MTPSAAPYRLGDPVRVLMWQDGLSGWHSTLVAGVIPDTGPSGYTWAVRVLNPLWRPGLPEVLTVGAWDDGNGNGLRAEESRRTACDPPAPCV